jgi:hypothetical protein
VALVKKSKEKKIVLKTTFLIFKNVDCTNTKITFSYLVFLTIISEALVSIFLLYFKSLNLRRKC